MQEDTNIMEAYDMAIDALTENESLAKSVIEASELLRKKRPHEEWEACLDTEYCKCSYCGTVVMLEESVRFHFCPNCGADMRKGGDS